MAKRVSFRRSYGKRKRPTIARKKRTTFKRKMVRPTRRKGIFKRRYSDKTNKNTTANNLAAILGRTQGIRKSKDSYPQQYSSKYTKYSNQAQPTKTWRTNIYAKTANSQRNTRTRNNKRARTETRRDRLEAKVAYKKRLKQMMRRNRKNAESSLSTPRQSTTAQEMTISPYGEASRSDLPDVQNFGGKSYLRRESATLDG